MENSLCTRCSNLDPHGSLFVSGGAQSEIQKLSHSIHELATSSSPYRSSDGTIFIGSKHSAIVSLDAETGAVYTGRGTVPASPTSVPAAAKSASASADAAAPSVMLVRTDYHISAVNGQSGEERWNVTLSHFVPEGIGNHLEDAQAPTSSDGSYEYESDDMEHPEFIMTNEDEQLILICRLPAGRSRPHPANSGCVRMPCAIRERVGQGGGGGLWEV